MTEKKKTDEITRLEKEMDALLSEISAWKPQSYDPTTDPLFLGYKDALTQKANLTMRDTMGQASALTAGYGNSYAVTAGQAAYDASFSKLFDLLPTLVNRNDEKNKQQYENLLWQYDTLKKQRDDSYKNLQREEEFDAEKAKYTIENEDFSSFTSQDFERYFLGLAYLQGKESTARLVEEMAKLNLFSKANLSHYLFLVDSAY